MKVPYREGLANHSVLRVMHRRPQGRRRSVDRGTCRQAQLTLSSGGKSLLQRGFLIYVPSRSWGVAIVDVSEPLTPREVQKFAEDISVEALEMEGEMLALKGHDGANFLFSLKAPLHPVLTRPLPAGIPAAIHAKSATFAPELQPQSQPPTQPTRSSRAGRIAGGIFLGVGGFFALVGCVLLAVPRNPSSDAGVGAKVGGAALLGVGVPFALVGGITMAATWSR